MKNYYIFSIENFKAGWKNNIGYKYERKILEAKDWKYYNKGNIIKLKIIKLNENNIVDTLKHFGCTWAIEINPQNFNECYLYDLEYNQILPLIIESKKVKDLNNNQTKGLYWLNRLWIWK